MLKITITIFDVVQSSIYSTHINYNGPSEENDEYNVTVYIKSQ